MLLAAYWGSQYSTEVNLRNLFQALTVLDGYVQILLRNGAELETGDDYGLTALHLASSRGHVTVASILFEAGASITSLTEDDETPFDLICTNAELEAPCNDQTIKDLKILLSVE